MDELNTSKKSAIQNDGLYELQEDDNRGSYYKKKIQTHRNSKPSISKGNKGEARLKTFDLPNK